MTRTAFADESGTHGSPACYAIGVLSVATNRLDRFNATFERLRVQHGVGSEVHWAKVDKGHGLINFGIDWLSRILRSSTARFDVIVVNTAQYRKWQQRRGDRESAFYTTYTYLLRHLARQVAEHTDVFIDDRNDSYDKQTEVIETIGNNMLAQLQSRGRLAKVTKVRSHAYPGVQIADYLTGVVAAGHRLLLDPEGPLNPGKRVAIQRAAQLLGWDALHYDTLPHSRFNIWHFPQEYRAYPATRGVRHARLIPFVSPEDLEQANAGHQPARSG